MRFVPAFSLGHNFNQCWPGRLHRELSGALGGTGETKCVVNYMLCVKNK